MKNKIIFVIAMIIVMAICAGVFSGCSGRLTNFNRDITTRLSREYGYIDASHEIIVDKETGVMYLAIYEAGVCVMVDKDGKPLISKDFG